MGGWKFEWRTEGKGEGAAKLLNLMFRSCLETVDVWDLN